MSYSPLYVAAFPYLANVIQVAQQNSGLVPLVGGGVMEGTELAGVGINPVTGLTVAPNSTLGTPAQLNALGQAALAAKQSAFPYLRGFGGR